ncbi:multidrug DMT transporter permease [Microbacterium protaetiae]|uniref:Multidrug DMT transporter permease n=1 Tax=Microbacterium protaetiae TaxID=2509458 RepID=A0A4V0YDU4_9MICO|nr:DMT family transporter [Microbacterium protaetiae]QAY61921.1 multidrug DMT transporter permease [Microbacterium protaetiae]
MPLADVTDQLVGVFGDPKILIGIPLALLGAVFMSFGAQYQYRGVNKVERITGTSGSEGLSGRQLLSLLRRPSWVIGTLMLGLAIVCQLSALVFAPLILVQPLGAISLVITTLLNARVSGHAPTRQSMTSIVACIGGILVFVTIAAFVATETPLTTGQILTVAIMLAVILVLAATTWALVRKRAHPLFYIVTSGILYGFVATLAKIVIKRVQAADFGWLTVVCAVGLLLAVALGAYFVQTAYSVGPPDLVIAGLTVIDPMVAVLIGLLVLKEAATANIWAFVGFLAAGLIAVYGVFSLARNHPQVISESQELPIRRGSHGMPGDKPKP